MSKANLVEDCAVQNWNPDFDYFDLFADCQFSEYEISVMLSLVVLYNG